MSEKDDLSELRKSDLFPRDNGEMSAPDRLLDPKYNDLIPRDNGELSVPPDLVRSPLFPRDDGQEIGPPELAPGHVERPPKVRKETGDLMDFLSKAAEGGGHGCERIQVELAPGLKASSCPSGGLSIFKNGVQVHSVEGLSAEDQLAINEYRERYK